MSELGVSIGRCTDSDIDDVLGFIDAHWQRGHILTRSRALLDWQHRDADGGGYSFIVARRGPDLVGILGYIATRRFDPAITRGAVVWLTMWRVIEQGGVPGLGLALLQRLRALEPDQSVGALGLNPATSPIYRGLGFRVGELQHYVRPNRRVERFELARLTEPVSTATGSEALSAFPLLDEAAISAVNGAIESLAQTPAKTARYFYSRYLRHPVYDYRVLELRDDAVAAGILVARVAEHAGRRALRIVDLVARPDIIARLGGLVDALLVETGAEYADLYNTGLEPHLLERGGFTRVDPEGADVVPDHFEPFERRNVRLWYAFTGEPVLYKGDADQDRPSRLADALV